MEPRRRRGDGAAGARERRLVAVGVLGLDGPPEVGRDRRLADAVDGLVEFFGRAVEDEAERAAAARRVVDDLGGEVV